MKLNLMVLILSTGEVIEVRYCSAVNISTSERIFSLSVQTFWKAGKKRKSNLSCICTRVKCLGFGDVTIISDWMISCIFSVLHQPDWECKLSLLWYFEYQEGNDRKRGFYMFKSNQFVDQKTHLLPFKSKQKKLLNVSLILFVFHASQGILCSLPPSHTLSETI